MHEFSLALKDNVEDLYQLDRDGVLSVDRFEAAATKKKLFASYFTQCVVQEGFLENEVGHNGSGKLADGNLKKLAQDAEAWKNAVANEHDPNNRDSPDAKKIGTSAFAKELLNFESVTYNIDPL